MKEKTREEKRREEIIGRKRARTRTKTRTMKLTRTKLRKIRRKGEGNKRTTKSWL